MARTFEVVFGLLFFIFGLSLMGMWIWGKVHRTIRREKQQDDLDRRLKF